MCISLTVHQLIYVLGLFWSSRSSEINWITEVTIKRADLYQFDSKFSNVVFLYSVIITIWYFALDRLFYQLIIVISKLNITMAEIFVCWYAWRLKVLEVGGITLVLDLVVEYSDRSGRVSGGGSRMLAEQKPLFSFAVAGNFSQASFQTNILSQIKSVASELHLRVPIRVVLTSFYYSTCCVPSTLPYIVRCRLHYDTYC